MTAVIVVPPKVEEQFQAWLGKASETWSERDVELLRMAFVAGWDRGAGTTAADIALADLNADQTALQQLEQRIARAKAILETYRPSFRNASNERLHRAIEESLRALGGAR